MFFIVKEAPFTVYVLSVEGAGGVTAPLEAPDESLAFEQAVKAVKPTNASTAKVMNAAVPLSVKAKVFLFEFVIHLLLYSIDNCFMYNR